VTYQPDIMTHLAGQWAGLHCTRCASLCSEAAPCVCCQAGVSHQSATLATGGVEELLADESERLPKFATGGVVSESKDQGDDSVPAMLSPGEVIDNPDRAEQLGMTADAKRLREGRQDQPEVEASAEPQAEVVFVTDDDAGVTGESSGG
jgi:hypothetical protein